MEMRRGKKIRMNENDSPKFIYEFRKCDEIKNSNCLDSWRPLFNFARSCLGNPRRGKKKGKSLRTIVKRQISEFTENVQ